MKRLLIGSLFLCFFTTASAQENSKIDSIDFCFKKYKVPENCTAKSQSEITDGRYRMTWIYMNEQMLKTAPEQMINGMQAQFGSFRKTPVSLLILGQQTRSYKITFTAGNQPHYQILSYGVINEMPVLVQLSLPADVITNADLPEFPRQLINFAN